MTTTNPPKPIISVLMPIYNAEQFLADALESILKQTFKDFELLLIDDGSTDRSVAIADTYAKRDDRIVIIRNGSNQGIVPSLNRGLKKARGKYVARMDADDISLPKRFERQVAFLETNPQVCVVGTSIRFIDEVGAMGDVSYGVKDVVLNRWLSLFHNPIAHPTVMVLTETLRRFGGYDQKAYHIEDFDLWLRMQRKQIGIVSLNEVLVYYRIHPQSVCQLNKEVLAESLPRLLHQRIKDFMPINKNDFLLLYKPPLPTLVNMKQARAAQNILTRLRDAFLNHESVDDAMKEKIYFFWKRRYAALSVKNYYRSLISQRITQVIYLLYRWIL